MVFDRKRKIRFLFFCALILIAVIFFITNFRISPRPVSKINLTFKEQETKYQAINGLEVSKDMALSRPLAVMIENHPDARPQSGLWRADVVYEALAEGGITRFLALYQTPEAKEIGPVRSAREYFAEIADEWGALYAHVGGSNEVIRQIKNHQYKNLDDANEYNNGEFFPRRKDKPEPHHIFTSTEKLRELIQFHQFSNVANFQPWQFKDGNAATSSAASKISIDFSRPGYEVGWEYNPSQNVYKRLQYFEPQIDESSGRQITAKTVVVQLVKVTPVPNDPLLSVDIKLSGNPLAACCNENYAEGKAWVFLDGRVIEARWLKYNDDRTRFYDDTDPAYPKEIQFNRGSIWVELVPKEKENNLKYK